MLRVEAEREELSSHKWLAKDETALSHQASGNLWQQQGMIEPQTETGFTLVPDSVDFNDYVLQKDLSCEINFDLICTHWSAYIKSVSKLECLNI